MLTNALSQTVDSFSESLVLPHLKLRTRAPDILQTRASAHCTSRRALRKLAHNPAATASCSRLNERRRQDSSASCQLARCRVQTAAASSAPPEARRLTRRSEGCLHPLLLSLHSRSRQR